MKRRRGGKRLRKSAAQITAQKWTAAALCAALALSLVGNAIAPIAFAAFAEEDPIGLCPHHEEHDESCGWQPAKEESPCTHEHDETCGYAAPVEETPCAHVHDETCGYAEGTEEEEGSPCTHEHDETCGYIAPVEGSPCTHVHDEACGFAEAVEERPCAFLCEWCVTAWEWSCESDEEAAPEWDEDAGAWGLGLPGASRERPVTKEVLEALLPGAATVRTAAGPKTVELAWNLSAIPEEGVWEGDYVLTAALPGEYVLTDGVPAPEVRLALGGGAGYDLTTKAINISRFIPRTGTSVYQDVNGVWSIDIRLPADLSPQELAERVKRILPDQVRGYTWTNSNLDGYTYESKPDTRPDGAPPYIGRLDLDWESLNSIDYGETILTPKGKSSPDIIWQINQGIGAESGTLQLKAVIQSVDLSPYIVSPAAPQNVKVNLFDYWVEGYGEKPQATQGDILRKSDSHYHEVGDTGTVSPDPTGYSTKEDWNLGINQGHLLLFGDGMIHAGLWNKGAEKTPGTEKRMRVWRGSSKTFCPKADTLKSTRRTREK